MTRHKDVYYTCNTCGNRLGVEPFEEIHGHTQVTVVNTDPAAGEPRHEYDLCATCWLKVYPILHRAEIEASRRENEKHNQERLDDERFRYRHPGFEG